MGVGMDCIIGIRCGLADETEREEASSTKEFSHMNSMNSKHKAGRHNERIKN